MFFVSSAVENVGMLVIGSHWLLPYNFVNKNKSQKKMEIPFDSTGLLGIISKHLKTLYSTIDTHIPVFIAAQLSLIAKF